MNPQRRTLLLVLGGVVVAAAALAVALVLVSRGGGDSASPASSTPARSSLFAALPQDGISLGKPSAPALYEFADLQCPYCGEYARAVLPSVVREYVRTGKVRLVFRGLAFIGPDSQKALQAVESAGLQNRLWDVMDALYVAQGAENSGWVTDDLLRQIGESIPGLDVDRWLNDMDSGKVSRLIADAAQHATDLGVNSTPTFFLGDQRLDVRELTPGGFRAALDPLLAS